MATEVTRSLKEINEEVVHLDKSIKGLTNENRRLDRSLRLDPSSTELLALKTSNLKEQVTLATEKVKHLRQAQVQMRQDVASGVATEEAYKKLSIQVAQAEASVKSLRANILKTANVKLDQLNQQLQGVSRVAKAVLASIVGIGVAFATTGDKIDKASKKYRISAEEFQKGAFIFDRATGDAESYEKSLDAITNQMTALQRGTARSVEAFARLSLTQQDLENKSPVEALKLLVSRLNQIEDADERAAVATQILGNAGVDLAQVAGLTAEEIASLNDELMRAGILTGEEAEKAAELKDKFDAFKLSMKKVVAELGVSLIPMFEALIHLANALIPIIGFLSSVFTNMSAPLQTLVAILLVVLASLPKLIALIKALNVVMLALGANPIALKIMLIAGAVAVLIILLFQLAKLIASIFGKKLELDFGMNIGGNLTSQVNQSQSHDGPQRNGEHTVNNYYDYSTMNNTVEYEADIEKIAEQLSTKIKVGGAR
jgi:phage-related minor tail protein